MKQELLNHISLAVLCVGDLEAVLAVEALSEADRIGICCTQEDKYLQPLADAVGLTFENPIDGRAPAKQLVSVYLEALGAFKRKLKDLRAGLTCDPTAGRS